MNEEKFKIPLSPDELHTWGSYENFVNHGHAGMHNEIDVVYRHDYVRNMALENSQLKARIAELEKLR